MSKEQNSTSYSNILRIAIPLMVSGLSMTIVNLTDTIFLSRLGETELGGAGNAVLLFTVLIELALGFSTGAQIILARRNGEGKHQAIGAIVQHSLVFVLILSLLIILLIQFGLANFTNYVVDSDAIRNVIHEYLNVRSWGIIFTSVNVIFMAFYVGITKTKIIGIITPIAALLNIILDYGLIFGNLGLPEMGVEGAALASNLADFITTCIYIFFTIFVYDHKRYLLFQWQGLQWSRYKNLLKISSPVMLQNFIALAAWFSFFTIIEHMGEHELAASHIVRSIYMVLIIPVFGLGETTNSLTGNLLGEKRVDKIWTLIKNSNGIGFMYCLLLQPVFYFGKDLLFSPFTEDLEIIAMGTPAMQVVFTALFIFTAVIVGFRVISGAGKTQIGLLIEVITVGVYLLSAWWLSQIPNVELYLVWTSEFIYFGVFILIVYPYLIWGNWRQAKV